MNTFCVVQAGSVGCPPVYQTQYIFYGGFTEGRSCSACSCGAPDGGTCKDSANAKVNFYDDPSCTTLDESDNLPASCLGLNGPGGDLGANLPNAPSMTIASPGSCTPNGGQPTGSPTPATPTTLCCL
jgi:hypothetical protein